MKEIGPTRRISKGRMLNTAIFRVKTITLKRPSIMMIILTDRAMDTSLQKDVVVHLAAESSSNHYNDGKIVQLLYLRSKPVSKLLLKT